MSIDEDLQELRRRVAADPTDQAAIHAFRLALDRSEAKPCARCGFERWASEDFKALDVVVEGQHVHIRLGYCTVCLAVRLKLIGSDELRERNLVDPPRAEDPSIASRLRELAEMMSILRDDEPELRPWVPETDDGHQMPAQFNDLLRELRELRGR